MTETFLFVYGTLKRGHRNHQLLKGWEFVSEAETFDSVRYALYQPQGYGFPYLYEPLAQMANDLCERVKGELYVSKSLSPFTILDYLEGVDSNHYKREEIQVVGKQFDPIFAWTYLATPDTYTEWTELDTELLKTTEKGDYYYEW